MKIQLSTAERIDGKTKDAPNREQKHQLNIDIPKLRKYNAQNTHHKQLSNGMKS